MKAGFDWYGRGGRWAVAAFAAIAAFTLYALGAFESLEHRLTSMRAGILDRQPTGEIAIVEIDARSLGELQTWPWPRRYHAEVVQRLHAAGASLIAFDVDFSARSAPKDDRDFAQALRDAEPVILPIFQQRASDQQSWESIIESRPAPIFDAAWVGGVNIFPGADGVVREYPAALTIGGQIRPSIAALLAESDDLGDRSFQPDWSIDARGIPRLSYVDVLAGRVPGDAIAGKRVLIGATAIELGDRYTIPRHGVVPGVVIQALAADALLQGRAITRTGLLPTLFGILLVAGLLGAPRYRRFNRSYPIAAIAAVALVVIVPLAVQSRWPLSIDSAPILVAAIACIAIRIALEARRRFLVNRLTDTETGLANRQALQDRMADDVAGEAILAAATIEQFDRIRDGVGTEAAAELVGRAAERIERGGDCKVYRIAPDVLAWLWPDESDDRIDDRMAALTEQFRQPVGTAAGEVDVSLTAGLDRQPAADGVLLKIERALAAIGAARAAGKSHQWFRGTDPGARRQLSLMGELRRGMAAGELQLVYQPKLHLRSGKVKSAEVLVRWHHPVDGLIPPDRFIPLAESTGVIHELTDFVLRTAAQDCARWDVSGLDACVAVNVSATDLGRPGFVDMVRDVIARSGIKPDHLALEVTEGAILRSQAGAVAVLTALRDLGLRLSIDDYGTGQSTLTYLKELPVHEVKIDKSFVTNLTASEQDRIMVRSTIGLAHELGLEVVAEGVEDTETLQLLHSLGCDFAQGYLIGRPVAFEDFSAVMETGPVRYGNTGT